MRDERFSDGDEEDTCQLQLFDGRPDAGKPMVQVKRGLVQGSRFLFLVFNVLGSWLLALKVLNAW